MLRDAINLLEQHNHIKEAAGMLLRIHRPNRAAIIYARHHHWESAANCFELAKMPFDAGKCAREAGDLRRAANNFLKAKKYEEACEALMDLGEYHEAARIHMELGNEDQATEIYVALLEKAPDLGAIKLNERELKVLTSYLLKGNINSKFAVVLANHNKLVHVIKEMLIQGDIKSATELHSKSIEDIGPQLIALENFTEQQNILLAELFLNVSNFEYAGMIYERLEQFEKAAETFEKAEKYARASYCYERAGQKQKSIILMHMAAEKGERNVPPQEKANEKFAIESSQASMNPTDDSTPGEATVIMDLPSKAEPQPRWVPPPPTAPQSASNNQSFDLESSPAAPAQEHSAVASAKKMLEMALETSFSRTADEFTNGRKHLDPPQQEPAPTVSESVEEYDEMMKLTPKSAIFNLIMTHPYFTDLNKEEADTVVNIIERHTFATGDVVIEFQVPASGMYFLNRGSIGYYRLENGMERHIETVHAPEIFGEMWLLTQMHANVKIVACKPSEVFVLNREKLMALLHMNPDLAMKLYKHFTQRLVSRFLNRQNPTQKKTA